MCDLTDFDHTPLGSLVRIGDKGEIIDGCLGIVDELHEGCFGVYVFKHGSYLCGSRVVEVITTEGAEARLGHLKKHLEREKVLEKGLEDIKESTQKVILESEQGVFNV